MKKVCVLMSTYNGEKYIKEQVESILNQQGVEITLLVRDDGSTDNTYDIITNEFPSVKLIKGKNIGYKKSFLTLLKECPESDYYAFSDQDDVWLEDKMIKAVGYLKDEEKPMLYCSNLKVVDENLAYLRNLHPESEHITLSDSCSLVENLSYGCTCVFNNALRNLANIYMPKTISHDGWINLICLHFGEAVYDQESYILYRQHGKNAIGGDRAFKSVWRKRLKSFSMLGQHNRDIQAQEFLRVFGEKLTNAQRMKVEEVAFYRKSISRKIRLLNDRTIKMCNFDRDFWYRVRIIFSAI